VKLTTRRGSADCLPPFGGSIQTRICKTIAKFHKKSQAPVLIAAGGVAAHFLHRHAKWREASGISASDCALMDSVLHQQSTSSFPCFAAAQSFGSPHKGQWWLGSAIIESAVDSWGYPGI